MQRLHSPTAGSQTRRCTSCSRHREGNDFGSDTVSVVSGKMRRSNTPSRAGSMRITPTRRTGSPTRRQLSNSFTYGSPSSRATMIQEGSEDTLFGKYQALVNDPMTPVRSSSSFFGAEANAGSFVIEPGSPKGNSVGTKVRPSKPEFFGLSTKGFKSSDSFGNGSPKSPKAGSRRSNSFVSSTGTTSKHSASTSSPTQGNCAANNETNGTHGPNEPRTTNEQPVEVGSSSPQSQPESASSDGGVCGKSRDDVCSSTHGGAGSPSSSEKTEVTDSMIVSSDQHASRCSIISLSNSAAQALTATFNHHSDRSVGATGSTIDLRFGFGAPQGFAFEIWF